MFVANIDDNATVGSVLTASAPGERQGGRRGAPPGGGAAAHTPAYLIRIAAASDGTFAVTNTRNGFQKTYKPRD
jgi:hypothetical protein